MLTIGSDPEFLVYSSSMELVPAQEIFSTGTSGIVGTDGCRALGELRPVYGNDPLEHVANVRKALSSANRIIKNFSPETRIVSAPSKEHTGTYSTGGHIHFGSNSVEEKVLLQSPRFGIFCDLFIGVPLLYVENIKQSIYRRDVKRYGRFFEYRNQNWGTEWRVPNSWVANRKLAEGVLSLAYVVGTIALGGKADVILKNTLINIDKETLSRLHWEARTKSDELTTIRDRAIGVVSKTTTYKTYEKQIAPLFKASKEHKCLYIDRIYTGWSLSLTTRIYLHDPIAFVTRVVRQIGKRDHENNVIVPSNSELYILRYLCESLGGSIDFVTKRWVNSPLKKIVLSGVSAEREKKSGKYLFVIAAPTYNDGKEIAWVMGKFLANIGYKKSFSIAIKINTGSKMCLSYQMRKQNPAAALLLTMVYYIFLNKKYWNPIDKEKLISLLLQELPKIKQIPFMSKRLFS